MRLRLPSGAATVWAIPLGGCRRIGAPDLQEASYAHDFRFLDPD